VSSEINGLIHPYPFFYNGCAMSRFVASLSRTWNWRAKISQDPDTCDQTITSRRPSGGQVTVRIDERSPTVSPVEYSESLPHTDGYAWPSTESDVMVGGEGFGICQEDLTSISENMTLALERFENLSRSEHTGETFDAFINSIEEKISVLYEEYESLIRDTTFDDEGRLNFGELDSEVTHKILSSDLLPFSEERSLQAAERSCLSIQQGINELMDAIDKYDTT
jgi:hypothetical protein